MREIQTKEIIETVSRLCVQANCVLNGDVRGALERSMACESCRVGREILGNLLENADIAAKELIPICQDTGMAVFFVELGQEAVVQGEIAEVDGEGAQQTDTPSGECAVQHAGRPAPDGAGESLLTRAINEGVRRGYREGYLRKSVVADPLRRDNTGDNTPAVIHYDIVPGDRLKITFAPKGFGSENMSALRMLKPSQGREGVEQFVLETVTAASSNPCPPIVVGVGIGGTFEKAAQLAKRALTRPVGSHHIDPYYAELEDSLLRQINALGIGPQGFGGDTTALGVNIETFPTHIAGLPVAINISCQVTRHLTAEL